ncbi:putative coactivator CBP, KIX domain superfamily, mediator complex subunit 15, KIX [Helianthus anomalus]
MDPPDPPLVPPLQDHPLYQEQLQQLSGCCNAESWDWRAQLQADIRERIVNKLFPPFPGHEGQHELTKIAERIEEEIYTVATTQVFYVL